MSGKAAWRGRGLVWTACKNLQETLRFAAGKIGSSSLSSILSQANQMA
jgi:hypothetical protein